MSHFTCAESNANEKNLLFSLMCIRFGTCEMRRLKRALESGQNYPRKTQTTLNKIGEESTVNFYLVNCTMYKIYCKIFYVW